MGSDRLTLRAMSHGLILHGTQFTDPEIRPLPTTYYSTESGLGRCLQYFPKTESLRIGAVGLGVGTIATWTDSTDYLRVYEINPDVIAFAKEYFYYLNDSKSKIDIVVGDARVSMEREAPQEFDIIVLDAFNSDSPPIHLLTEEAFKIYYKHLKKDGAIAIHISSKHLDFYPAMTLMAKQFHTSFRFIRDENPKNDVYRMISSWILISDNIELLNAPEVMKASSLLDENKSVSLWTDDHSSIFSIFIW